MGAKLNTMYHIVKSKGQFMVVLVGRNGEALSTSERFTTKAKAWGNVDAQRVALNYPFVYAQDDTLPTPKVYYVWSDTDRVKSKQTSRPRYTPGPNPKKKKV